MWFPLILVNPVKALLVELEVKAEVEKDQKVALPLRLKLGIKTNMLEIKIRVLNEERIQGVEKLII